MKNQIKFQINDVVGTPKGNGQVRFVDEKNELLHVYIFKSLATKMFQFSQISEKIEELVK